MQYSSLTGSLRPARANAQMRHQRRGVMPLVRAEIEEPPVQAERAVVIDFDDMVEQLVEIGRAAIGGEPHDLVLALVDLEPEILGEHRVEQPERIREMDRPDFGQAVALAEMHCRGLVLADPVEGDDDGALERRGEERRGGVRAVMRSYARPGRDS